MDNSPRRRPLLTATLVLVAVLAHCHGALPCCSLPFDVSDDESSLVQVSGKVVRRGLQDGLAASVADSDSGKEAQASPCAVKPTPASATVVELRLPLPAATSKGARDAETWLDFSRRLWRENANAIPAVMHFSDSLFSAVAVVVFALAVVAMALISFRLFENRSIQDKLAALEDQKDDALHEHNQGLAERIQHEIEDLKDQVAPKSLARPTKADRSLSLKMPELHGCIVPENRKFLLKMPPLVCLSTEMPTQHQVLTNSDMDMFLIKLSRRAPHERTFYLSEHIIESLTISLPENIDQDLILCTFGRPAGHKLRCEIYRTSHGKTEHFGCLQEDSSGPCQRLKSTSSSRDDVSAYTLFLAGSGKRYLSVVVRGDVRDRDAKIVDGAHLSNNTATTVRGERDGPYQVECYPHSDVILAVILLASVDRLASGCGQDGAA